MKQFQDLVTLAPWTFIFQICNLLILTAGVKHFLFKPVQQILAKRKEEIEASYTEAEKAEGDAQAYKHRRKYGKPLFFVFQRPTKSEAQGRWNQ